MPSTDADEYSFTERREAQPLKIIDIIIKDKPGADQNFFIDALLNKFTICLYQSQYFLIFSSKLHKKIFHGR